MTLRRDMKDFLETVLSAYERRVQVFGRAMRETNRMLQDLRAEEKVLLAELREKLARTRSLRRKDFDRMMTLTGLPEKEQKDLVAPVLEEFEKEGRALCEVLRRACEGPRSGGLGELKALSAEILSRLEGKEREAVGMLRRSQLRQQELSGVLRGLSSKGEGLRIEDVRRALQGLRLRQAAGESEPGRILDDLETARGEANLRWQKTLGNGEDAAEKLDKKEATRWETTTRG